MRRSLIACTLALVMSACFAANPQQTPIFGFWRVIGDARKANVFPLVEIRQGGNFVSYEWDSDQRCSPIIFDAYRARGNTILVSVSGTGGSSSTHELYRLRDGTLLRRSNTGREPLLYSRVSEPPCAALWKQEHPHAVSEDFDPNELPRFLADEKLVLHRSKAWIPPSVMRALDKTSAHGHFAIADAGKPFQSTDFITDESLPDRRLIFVATSARYCALYYEKGGEGLHELVLVFRIDRDPARIVWGGVHPRRLSDVASLKGALRSDVDPTWIEMNW